MMPRTRIYALAAIAALGLVSILAVGLWRLRASGTPNIPAPDYWPTRSWQTTSPEEQGFDSTKLAAGLQAIQQKGIPIHSLLIVRNGRVLIEADFYPYDGQAPHSTASVTKSLMTTLIGIAADQGKLSLDDRLVSFFPEYTIANPGALKDQITIRNLVSMSAGQACVGLPSEATVADMEASPNWVQFALDRPMAYPPGTHWEYCGLGMHLLSAILQRATGMTALEFARQNLFEPLGIRDVVWPTDPQGINMGAGNARLYARDMAKIGFLWLHQGWWDGKQVVSRTWVNDSIQQRFATPVGDGYGYGWWTNTGSAGPEFFAEGNGGQRILVIPALNAVLVTLGGGFDTDEVTPYLAAALVDPKKPLPANPAGMAELNTVLSALSRPPAPQAAAPLPDVAKGISGKTFRLDENPMKLSSLRLDFNNPREATVQFAFTDGTLSPVAVVGLDGVYRLTPGMNLDRAFHTFADFQDLSAGLRGHWSDAQTFMLDYDTIVNRYFYQLEMRFEANGLAITASERGSESRAVFRGSLQNP